MSLAKSPVLSLFWDGITSDSRLASKSAGARKINKISSERRSKSIVSSPATGITEIPGRQRPHSLQRRRMYYSKCSLNEESGESQNPRDSSESDPCQTSAKRGASTSGGRDQIDKELDSRGKPPTTQDSSAKFPQKSGRTPASNAALAALQRAKAYKAQKNESSPPPPPKETMAFVSPRPPEMDPRPEKPSVPPVQTPTADQPVSLANLMPLEMQKMQELQLLAALASTSASTTASTLPSDNDNTLNLTTPSLPTSSDQAEVQIITRDGIITRKVDPLNRQSSPSRIYKPKGLSSTDFLGLGFEDKKDPRAVPAGLRAPMDKPRGSLPAVEILTREANSSDSADAGEGSMYKPKVSTWGVFPRPRDISSTYGGGRTIRPGESLETEEERAGREAKTRQLLENYRKVAGLDMEAGTKARCQQCLERGGQRMDAGRLREALEDFEVVLSNTVFQNPIHGHALLQKAVCLDSMARSRDAKELYEKLSTHPDSGIRKKSRQMLFGFQWVNPEDSKLFRMKNRYRTNFPIVKAAESLRVSGLLDMDTSLYRPYFDAFADGYNSTYKASEEEKSSDMVMEALPYAAFLILPLVIVLVIVFH